MALSPVARTPDHFAWADVGVKAVWFEWLVTTHRPHLTARASLGNFLGNFDYYYYSLVDMPTMLLFVCYVYEARKHSMNRRRKHFSQQSRSFCSSIGNFVDFYHRNQNNHTEQNGIFHVASTAAKRLLNLRQVYCRLHRRTKVSAACIWDAIAAIILIVLLPNTSVLEMTVFLLVSEHLFRRTWMYLQNVLGKKYE